MAFGMKTELRYSGTWTDQLNLARDVSLQRLCAWHRALFLSKRRWNPETVLLTSSNLSRY